MIKKIFIGAGILCGAVIVCFIIYMVTIIAAFGGFDKDYSVSDLKKAFEKTKPEIYDLKNYFKDIVPPNRFVEIEFKDDNTLGRLGIKALDSSANNPHKYIFLEWDLKINAENTNGVFKSLGWTKETLKTLKEKLDKANCIQIESGEPAKIGFQRSGMGMYSFIVFDNPIFDTANSAYNDGCTYILADERLALRYDGGAVGNQCFYNKE